MDHTTPGTLATWQNFYVIVGSAAGALTGLQFVVITLITQAKAGGSERDVRAFGTPTVIHFCTALLVSAVMAAPWPTWTSLGACLTTCGVAGMAYSLRVFFHARKTSYKPEFSDWAWYVACPLLAHLALLAAAILNWWNIGWAPVIVAADALGFLFLGVRNAWDTVTYIATRHSNLSHSSETNHPAEPA